MYWFELGREYRLSLAEIWAFFPKANQVFISEKIIILGDISQIEIDEFTKKCGGTIKVFRVIKTLKKPQAGELIVESYETLTKGKTSGKVKYGINMYGERVPALRAFLPPLKQKLKWEWVSSRFLNQNFMNLSSAIILWEKIVASWGDLNFIFAGESVYFWVTVWVQDINAYSKRDFGKKRDMQVGMLPPKLAQVMINIALWNKRNAKVYDPFCGLGTVLIESAFMGNKQVYWSDKEISMVQATQENMAFLKQSFGIELDNIEVISHDAMQIGLSPILKSNKIDAIVTEGYLGEIFTHQDGSFDKVTQEKRKLTLLYQAFFESLKKSGWKWTLVICFPFWDVRGKFTYFTEIYDVVRKYCDIQTILPQNDFVQPTRSGSLLYKRSNQLVWREIFKLKIK